MHDHAENQCATLPRAEQIARLNDRLRQQGHGGRVVVTRGVMSLPAYDAAVLIYELAGYNGFDVDNDPHGERDLGDMTLFGADMLWKIDYYDLTAQYGSADPADGKVTHRVLTVMLATEY